MKRLIEVGELLEKDLGLEKGQFRARPGGLGGNRGAFLAAIIVYGAAFVGWMYLGLCA